MIWKTLLVLAAVATLWLTSSLGRDAFEAVAPSPRAELQFELDDVALVAQEADGSWTRVEIGTVRVAEAKVAFFRSPLLRRLEVRDLRVLRDGAEVEHIDRLKLGALTSPATLPESLRDSAVLTALADLATRE